MNEVKLLNIGGIDQNVKDQYARDIIAPSENGLDSTSNLPVASRPYKTGEFLIGQDRLYYEAITDIEIGDTLVVNVNIKATTVSAELISLRNKSADAAIECIAPMEKTGLSSAEYKVGEYLYWDYGLNAGLYKAKIGINIGDAFVVDTNIEAAEPIAKTLTGLREEFNQVNNNLGVKNLLPNNAVTQTLNGITITVNNDGTIRTVGSATSVLTFDVAIKPPLSDGTYILSGCPQGGANDTYYMHYTNLKDTVFQDYGEGVEFTPFDYTLNPKARVRICIKPAAGEVDLLFKPMIRPTYITDDTYEPYARSNQELAGEVEPILNVLGAKNLLPTDAAATQTVNGITFTVNNDGTITINGTATALVTFALSRRTISFDIEKQYILSGFGEKTSSNAFIQINWGSGSYTQCTHEEYIFTPLGTGITSVIAIAIAAGESFSNYIIKPMIRLASIKDDTYVPYAKTNRELTAELTDDTGWVSVNSNLKYRKIGHVVSVIANTIYPSTSWTTIGVLPENARPSYPFYQNGYTSLDAMKACNFYINTIGQVQCQANAAVSANLTYLV